MSLKKVLPYALTALMTLTLACGDDDDDNGTEPTGDELSAAEVESMMEAMAQVMIFAPGFSPPPAGIAAQSEPFEEIIPCPLGGTVRVFGTFAVGGTQQAPTVTADLQQAFSACKASADDGTQFTFSGTPTLDLTFGINAQTGSYNFSIHNGGNVGWGTGSKSGTCGINTDITATVTQSFVVTNGNLTGTVCNRPVTVQL